MKNQNAVRINRHGKEVLTRERYEDFVFEQVSIPDLLVEKRKIFKSAFPVLFRFEDKAEHPKAKEAKA